MTKHATLTHGQAHIINLLARDRDEHGWAKVSEQLYPVLSSSTPSELVTFEKLEVGGRARLTENGEKILYALDWLVVAPSR
jgi:DNA-binding PadR family transcriptional regulator